MKKVLRYLGSRVRIVWWKLRGWETFVSCEVFGLRMDDCATCPHRDEEKDECRLCGCPIEAKTVLASEKCPIDKWKRQKISSKKP